MKGKKSYLFILLLVTLAIPCPGSAQNWTGVLDSSRAIDWSNSGVPGGIPYRTTACATISASTYSNGATDATAGIQSALNSCASGQVVALSTGTFLINSGLKIPSNVTLRGAGTRSTILNAKGTGGAVIAMGSGSPSASSSVNITGGASAGSTSLTLSSTTGITTGSYLLITELNDASYVTITVPNGTCSWCDNSMWSGTRARGQIVEVLSVSGTTVGINPGLYTAYGVATGTGPAMATPYKATAKYAGVEDLQIYANNTGYSANISIAECAYCWVRGVEGNYADGDHVDLNFSYRCEIRDSYFSNAYSHVAGSTDADIMMAGKTTGTLVENNILERLHTSVMLNWGAAGNVIGYNYSTGSYDSSATNSVMIDFAVHGAHPQFNLWEGNVTPHIFPDSFWGTGAYNTAFRNWSTGTTLVAPYADGTYTGRKVINWAGGHLANQQNRGISLAFTQTRYNLIGNVAGSADATTAAGSLYNSGPAACTSCEVAPANRNYSGTFYAFDFGYNNGSDTNGGSVPAAWVGVSYSTAVLHGNYDTASKSVIWNSGITQSLPASFYRNSKPAWFGSIAWPAIGPEVSGGIDAGGHAYAIPAEACYKATARDSNGMLLFDPAACYGTSSTAPKPASPSSLTAIVH